MVWCAPGASSRVFWLKKDRQSSVTSCCCVGARKAVMATSTGPSGVAADELSYVATGGLARERFQRLAVAVQDAVGAE